MSGLKIAAADDEVCMSSQPDDAAAQVLESGSSINRAPECGQCMDRNLVWALVVRCCQEAIVELEDFNYDAAPAVIDARMMRRMALAEMQGARLSLYRRAVYIDVCLMRTSLINLKKAYAANSWEHREADRLRDCINAMYDTMEDLKTRDAVCALYATTLRYELGAVHTSTMRLNELTGPQSSHDAELIFRARLAAILMSDSTALEPNSLHDFLRAEVPVLRAAVSTLERRLAQDSAACLHNF